MIVGPVLLFATLQAVPAPAAAEPVSSYRIQLRAAGRRLDISGTADFPKLRAQASSFDFYLSALIDKPQLTLRCGRRALPLEDRTSVLEVGDRKWTLRAKRPCAAGQRLRLAFRYSAEGTAAPQMRLTESWSFAGGGGELWYPQRSFAERQVGRIEIDVPAGYTAIATGSLVRRRSLAGRARFRYAASRPAKFAFAYGPYAEAVLGGERGVRVLSSGSKPEAQALVRSLDPVVAALVEAFGAASFSSFALVEVPFDGRVLGTSEYGMIFAPRSRMSGDFDAPYWGHEVGHQWWGNAVRSTGGTPGAALLTEGLAEYGALIALEATQGRAAAAQYRRTRSLSSYRGVVKAGKDRAPGAFLPQGQEEILLAHQLATSKGALVLRYLSSLIDERRFHALLRSFLTAKAGGRTSWAELEAWIKKGTDNRYDWVFDQWLHQPGLPEISVSYCVEGKSARGLVQQLGQGSRLLLPIELSGAWGSRRVTVDTSAQAGRFAFEAAGPIEQLTVDPDAVVPALSRNSKRVESCP